MQTKKYSVILALVLMAGPGLALSFGRALPNISGLKLGKDKGVSEEADSFAPDETIYISAQISNVASTVNVKARLLVEDVPGQEKGPIPGLEATLNMGRNGTADFDFSAPNKGWPKGKYAVEVIMAGQQGEELDKKSAELTVE
jgi:hypothetical protein